MATLLRERKDRRGGENVARAGEITPAFLAGRSIAEQADGRRAGPPESIIRRASAVDDKPDLSSAASAKEEGWQLFGEFRDNHDPERRNSSLYIWGEKAVFTNEFRFLIFNLLNINIIGCNAVPA